MKIKNLSGLLKDKRRWSTRTNGGHTDQLFYDHYGLMEAKTRLLKKEDAEIRKGTV